MKASSLKDRVLSIVLATLMVFSVFPMAAFASTASSLSSNIGQKDFVVGKPTEFTYTTHAGEDASKMVVGVFEFSDDSAIETVEYLETMDGNWYVLPGKTFGPASGFPLTDGATSTFRVNFNKPGNYTIQVKIIEPSNENKELCSLVSEVNVRTEGGSLSTDIDTKKFILNEPMEYTYTTMAYEDAGKMVVGSFDFSDMSAVSKIEYLESKNGIWYTLPGTTFGPETGFPLTDNATSRFRVTFCKPGKFNVKVSILDINNSLEELFSLTSIVEVEKKKAVLTTDLGTKDFIVGETTEYTFTTMANDYADTMVIGKINLSDSSAVDSIEYYETKNGNWYPLPGTTFGPEAGFPLKDNATSRFRIKFAKPGAFTASVDIIDVNATDDAQKVVCSSGDINLSVKAKYDITSNVGEGGTLKIDGNAVENGTAITKIEGEKATISVVANENYLIQSVTINSEEQDLGENKAAFTKEIDVDSNIVVNVSFVRIYTVSVNAHTNGKVETTPAYTVVDGVGKLEVKDGTSVSVVATADANYRVSKVEINTDSEEFADNTYNASNPYTKSLVADKDYTITVTFAPYLYQLETNNPENGQITADSTAAHGTDSVVTVIPESGYTINTFKVNGTDVDFSKITLNENGSYVYTIENITANQIINVTLKEIAQANFSDVSFSTPIRTDLKGTVYTYIYSSSAPAVISTDKSRIRVTYTDGTLVTSPLLGTPEITISENKEIAKIEIFYLDVFKLWHEVSGISSANPLRIVIDKVKPIGEINTEKKIYSENFNITFTARDINKLSESSDVIDQYICCSGIQKIEYYVTYNNGTEDVIAQGKGFVNDDETVDDGVLFNRDSGDDINTEETVNFLLDTSDNKYDGKKLTVHMIVTDCANNVSEEVTYDVDVNTKAPVVELSGSTIKSAESVAENYNTDRVITVKFNDYRNSFDKAAAESAIKVNGQNVSAITWDESNDAQTAHFTLSEEGTYTVTVDSYTNLAGKSSEPVSIATFIIDKHAPINYKISIDPEGIWDILATTITFGKWRNHAVEVSATAQDEISGVKEIKYYKTTGEDDTIDKLETDAEKEAALNSIFENGAFVSTQYVVSSDEAFVVYARIVDNAGNVVYISTNGIIVDLSKPAISDISFDKGYTEENTETGADGYFYGSKYAQDHDNKLTVNFKVSDRSHEVYSGIKEVYYWVTSADAQGNNKVVTQGYGYDNGDTTETGTLYTYTQTEPVRSQLEGEKELSFDIDLSRQSNQGDYMQFHICAIDNAGNSFVTDSQFFGISVNKPTIDITVVDTANERAENSYITGRTATIKVTEPVGQDNGKAFNKDRVIFDFSTTNANGTDVEAKPVVEWNGQTATIKFEKDAHYVMSVAYRNKAGNDAVINAPDANTYDFTVDNNEPTSSLKVNENIWTKLLYVVTFGLYDNKSARVIVSNDDVTSPVKSEYYISDGNVILTQAELEQKYNEGNFSLYNNAFDINTPAKFTVYVRTTDAAGNYNYICSDGHILEKAASVITLTPADATNKKLADDSYGYYNGDVDVKINVLENSDIYSGIKKITYSVEKDGDVLNPTQSGTLYSFDYQRNVQENSNSGTLNLTDWNSDNQQNEPTQTKTGNYPSINELKKEWNGTLRIIAAKNNSSNVILRVNVEDNAGNISERIIKLDIDITAPSIEVSYDNNNAANASYFNAQRKATVVITERTNHFSAQSATESIANAITAKNLKNEDIDKAFTISEWKTVKGNTSDEDKHTAIVSFSKDANYELEYSYTDIAANKNTDVNFGSSVAPTKFTVDTVNPYGSITAKAYESTKPASTWNALIGDREALTFGFWSKKSITLSGTSGDVTSPIEEVKYYKVDNVAAKKALSSADLDALDVSKWIDFNGFTVEADEQCVVYVKIKDYASNYTYISTNGLIADKEAPEENISPIIVVEPESNAQPINGIYNKNVKVNITVTDPIVNGSYSGLKFVSYEVYNLDVDSKTPTQKGTLYNINEDKSVVDATNPMHQELKQELKTSIVVDKELNNTNNVLIKVYAQDNSLNDSNSNKSIKIDKTAPKISVVYFNNLVENGKYFKANRTAQINITERNFNPDDVVIKITSSDGKIPAISGWKVTSKGTEPNGDGIVHTATITYAGNSDYTFNIAFTDKAGNKNTEVNYNNAKAPTKFTVDKKPPIIKITYNNIPVENTNYYSKTRVATITVDEHNFNSSFVIPKIQATDDGKPVAAPNLSAWTNSGDIHTATITYSADARYVFDILCTDLAGNSIVDVQPETFFVDNRDPEIKFGGVKDNSANNADEIKVSVQFSDVNYDSSKAVVTLTGAKNKQIEFNGVKSDIHNGQIFTFKNFEKNKKSDDIYTLTARLVDKAGRKVEKTLHFSVNRFGSTYLLEGLASEINHRFIKSSAVKDIQIKEINPNELSDIELTLFKDGDPITLKQGTDYLITTKGGNGTWYEYTYTVFANLLKDEGPYVVQVYSKDAAGNVSKNDFKNKNTPLQFGVDDKKPELTITNLESGTTYFLDKLAVKFTSSDNYSLANVKVYVDEKLMAEFSSKDIKKILNGDGTFTFDIDSSNSKRNVRIVSTDSAGNSIEKEINNFYVTTNRFVQFYTNTPLLIGTIVGIAAAVVIIVILVSKKRKKSEEKEKNISA